MKILAFEVREDEKAAFEKAAADLAADITLFEEALTEASVEKVCGYEAVTVLGQSILNAPLLNRLSELGIQFIATRTIGYNHIDVAFAREKGMRVSHSGYAPNGVADYTVMLMLMCIRHYKQAMFRGNVNDYSLSGLQGKEMRHLTVGVVGTGRIGAAVIGNLSGFGCKVLAYDKHENEQVKALATYVDLEALYRESDIITLHVPATSENYHMLNRQSIGKMKDGVVLINCARGELMNLADLTEGIESRKIGALGLDCVENEEGIYHHDRRTDIIINRDMAYLRQFPNVVMTQHMAFYTDAAVNRMVQYAVESLCGFMRGDSVVMEVK